MTQSCNCDPNTVNPAEHFYAKGNVHVFMVLNLDAYLDDKNLKQKSDLETLQQKFIKLRGGAAFADAAQTINPEKYFLLDEKDKITIEHGHDFQVFRRHLVRDWFSPTYLFQKDTVELPNDFQVIENWDKYELRIRLSRAGFLEVKLTRPININKKIIDILRDLMEMQIQSDGSDSPMSPQLKLVLFCADKFIESISKTISINEPENDTPIKLSLKTIGLNPDHLPYRQRYASLVFEEIICSNCNGRVEADKLKNDHWDILAALLEGVLIKHNDGTFGFPEMDDEVENTLNDLASWKNDLCMFSPERCLIYFPPENIVIPSRSGTKSVSYKDYWECIIRGIEHTIVIRTALQSIEYYTTSTLESDPRLTEKVVDKEITEQDKDDIRKLARAFSYSYKTLPILRDVLVPSSSYRASYAINKFEKLNSVLHIREIKEHVERNIDELVSFVQFYSSMELQQELNKSQEAIDNAGFIITIIALFIAIPSFLADFDDIFHNIGDFQIWLALIILITVARFLWIYFKKQIEATIKKIRENEK
ncbi:MAG: hypothetical protein JNM51_07690 [Bacteroidia bacterium]|nr:hypothetical protein [Bacteroidia bacterium]